MKKVCYVAAAVGVPSAFGLMIPAATASAAATPKHAKTVSLNHSAASGTAATRLTCNPVNANGASSFSHFFHQETAWSGSSCIASVTGKLHTFQSGLEMRTRVYSVAGGGKVFQGFVHGKHVGNGVSFHQAINKRGLQVCAALVFSSKPSFAAFGPVCISTR